ncbi:MAG: hypothetical protein OK436_05770, partial [Thaumarchaeota archaeon]|nr:hypothetical protein [Nitrososphaerota archaeon]
EANVLASGNDARVPIEKDGKTTWVDQKSLSAKQQAEVSDKANELTPSELPKTVREGLTGTAAAASPESAYQQLADAQANQYLAMTKALDPLTSGAALPALEGTAAANASQMLGQSATSPVSQWLNQQTSAAQHQNAPAAAANAQVGVAQDYASTLLAGGLQNMGKAENQMMQAAPYQQLLQSLAADVPYKLLGGETLAQILPTVSTAEKGLGLSTTGAPQVKSPTLPSLNTGIIPGAPLLPDTGPPAVK